MILSSLNAYRVGLAWFLVLLYLPSSKLSMAKAQLRAVARWQAHQWEREICISNKKFSIWTATTRGILTEGALLYPSARIQGINSLSLESSMVLWANEQLLGSRLVRVLLLTSWRRHVSSVIHKIPLSLLSSTRLEGFLYEFNNLTVPSSERDMRKLLLPVGELSNIFQSFGRLRNRA